jgi:hypothetical protein
MLLILTLHVDRHAEVMWQRARTLMMETRPPATGPPRPEDVLRTFILYRPRDTISQLVSPASDAVSCQQRRLTCPRAS